MKAETKHLLSSHKEELDPRWEDKFESWDEMIHEHDNQECMPDWYYEVLAEMYMEEKGYYPKSLLSLVVYAVNKEFDSRQTSYSDH